MPDEASGLVQSPQKTPRRRPRRLWRVTQALALLAASGVVLHLLWGFVGRWQLMRIVDEYRKTGEPMLPEDFAGQAVPDAQNAALKLRSAAAMMIPFNDEDLRSDGWVRLETPLTTEEIQRVGNVISANRRALDLVDTVDARWRFDWHLKLTTPFIRLEMTDPTEQHGLGALLALAALYSHETGDDATAIRRVEQLLLVSRGIDREPALLAHLVSLGLSARAAYWIESNAPALRITSTAPDAAPAKAGDANPASANQVKSLIDDLLSQDADNARLIFAIRGDRMEMINTALALVDGNLPADAGAQMPGMHRPKSPLPKEEPPSHAVVRLTGLAVKPFVMSDARELIRRSDAALVACKSSDWPSCAALWPEELDSSKHSSVLHSFEGIFHTHYRPTLQCHFSGLTDRRLAAVALAVRLYEIDHAGSYPARLSDLVPQYLPYVPADPMAPDRLLSYSKAGPNGGGTSSSPITYSVGLDNIDQGGSERSSSVGDVRSGHWGTQDEVFHLAPQPRERLEEGRASK